MKILNIVGPNIGPWVATFATGCQSEKELLITTPWGSNNTLVYVEGGYGNCIKNFGEIKVDNGFLFSYYITFISRFFTLFSPHPAEMGK